MMPKVYMETYPSAKDVADRAARWMIDLGQICLQRTGRFSIALSGGSTPDLLYELLASQHQTALDWSKVHLFWGDERCVPPDHPQSNFCGFNERFIRRLPQDNQPVYHRMKGELPPLAAATEYEADLRSYFGMMDSDAHSFDLTLLGMGEDGHTASLFPGTQAVHENQKWVVAHYIQKLDTWRLSLTPAILNQSAEILILVTGKAKAKTLEKVLHGPYQPDLFPIQVIQPRSGEVRWLLDRDAAQG